MGYYLNFLSKLQQAADYNALRLAEVYEDYSIYHLLALVNDGLLNQKTLAKKLGMTEPALSMKLKILEKKNYISKKKSTEDKRNYILVLSDEGKQIIRDYQDVLNNHSKELLSNLSNEELQAFEKLLDKMSEKG